jgi:hypothetical protein
MEGARYRHEPKRPATILDHERRSRVGIQQADCKKARTDTSLSMILTEDRYPLFGIML